MKRIFFPTTLAILLAFTGCQTKQLLKCPDIASTKKHHEIWAKAKPHREHITNNSPAESSNSFLVKNKATASIDNDKSPLQVKIPRMITRKLTPEDLQSANDVFAQYSGNQVKIEQNDKGKYYLKASSRKDFFKLMTALAAVKRSSVSAAPGGGGGIAVAGGILGIIAIILSLGPYVSYSAFLLGLLALIFGIIGLGSSRRGWAVTGIVLGVLAIIFAGVIGIGLYTIVLHI